MEVMPYREEICRDGGVLMLWGGWREPGASPRGIHQEAGKTWLGLSLAPPHLSLLRLLRAIKGEVFNLYTTRWLVQIRDTGCPASWEAKVLMDGDGN